MLFKKIVIAIDLDETTWPTLEKVREIGLSKEVEIHLVHAFEIAPVAYDFLASYLPTEIEKKEIQQVVEAKLAGLVERLGLKNQSKVKCQCLVSGNARQDFLNYVEKLGCDLIITASQEKTLMRGIFEGSFSSYLNKYARPNLLVLRPA